MQLLGANRTIIDPVTVPMNASLGRFIEIVPVQGQMVHEVRMCSLPGYFRRLPSNRP